MSGTLFQRMLDISAAGGERARASMARRIAERMCRERCAALGEPPCFEVAPGCAMDCGSTTETDDITCQIVGEIAVEEIWL